MRMTKFVKMGLLINLCDFLFMCSSILHIVMYGMWYKFMRLALDSHILHRYKFITFTVFLLLEIVGRVDLFNSP